MTYDIYRLIFTVGAIAAGVMLAVTVLLFILLRIPMVIGDLTGRRARREIEEIRSKNEQSGAKRHKTSAVNQKRGRLTEKIPGITAKMQSNAAQPQMAPPMQPQMQPQNIPGNTGYAPAQETAVLYPQGQAAQTEVLSPAGGCAAQTEVLQPGMAGGYAGQTEVLSPNGGYAAQPGMPGGNAPAAQAGGFGETVVLGAEPAAGYSAPSGSFTIEYEITYIHTDEII